MSWMQPALGRGRFDDLIFCPLDLSPPPEIDVKEFIEWMRSDPLRTGEYPKAHYERVTGNPYPWLMRSLSSDLEPLRAAFPQVHAYCAQYPLKPLKTVIFLAQNGHQSVFTHTDSDGLVGLRFYLANKNVEGLHFYRGKEKYDSFSCYPRDAEGRPISANLPEYFDMESKIYARFPSDVRSFMLNSARAAHGIDSNTCELGDRIAVLVQGEVDATAYEALIERSLEKYGQFAIWY